MSLNWRPARLIFAYEEAGDRQEGALSGEVALDGPWAHIRNCDTDVSDASFPVTSVLVIEWRKTRLGTRHG